MVNHVLDKSPRSDAASAARFLLWVDAVGGYFGCWNQEVVIGRSAPHAQADVQVLADIARRHAKIRRGGEGYLIEAIGDVRVEGKPVDGAALLSDGDEIELGEVVRLRFTKPHALSASARLDFLSSHRTRPKLDGVILMAESCVLGPNWNNHIVCRDWKEDVVLFRKDDQLFCRSMEDLLIDGAPAKGPTLITHTSHVSGERFAMSLEKAEE